ncbi:MAG: putative glycosyl transferase protein [Promethearchaeota archaeon]|nr:MAG: putative glycosyl transferase protein [Candidatus Lokiarchaeota archaeon]
MKAARVLAYGIIVVSYFVLLHLLFPLEWASPVKNAIDTYFTNPLTYWWFIFPLIGLLFLLGLDIFYGIYFLSSFGRGYRTKEPYYPNISIMIPSKNEKVLLKKTLESILNSKYPKDHIQLILITSESTDGTTEYSKEFASKYDNIMDITTISEVASKQGKPPKLNLGLKQVKHEIVVLYDCGCILQQDTLTHLISPFQKEKVNAVIGPVLVENWKTNILTRGIFLDYAMISGGGITFEVKNRLGSSAYSYGRNFAVSTKYLREYGGFNEDSMTEDLYLSVLLNLDGVRIRYSPKAKIYEYVPSTWKILVKQRTRWLAGFIYDMPELMQMKKGKKSGKPIIISRNMTMMLIGNLDTWISIVMAFSLLFGLIGEYYLLGWSLSCLIFQFGYIINAIWKYCDKHFSLLLFWPISGYIHLFMFLRQFKLPEEMSWEQTPMIFEKQEEEIMAITEKIQ